MPRHFVSQCDLSGPEIWEVFRRTQALKPARPRSDLAGRTLVMYFEKASTRTRLSFEVGMTQLGGHAIYVDTQSSQIARGESLSDTAQVVSRYADLIMARVFAHQTVADLARHSSVPVINGLSDDEHPCQTMADLFTVWEKRGELRGTKLAFVGDGDNNVTHSLLLICAILGVDICVAAPAQFAPQERFVAEARGLAALTGSRVEITEDPIAAVRDAGVVYTDVWVSMGREADEDRRLATLRPYQVSAELVRHARPDFLFMHCLPAHVGHEVTDEVAYGPNSVIFDEAENRLHVQKALMLYLLEGSRKESA